MTTPETTTDPLVAEMGAQLTEMSETVDRLKAELIETESYYFNLLVQIVFTALTGKDCR